jgi:hypothetical protein
LRARRRTWPLAAAGALACAQLAAFVAAAHRYASGDRAALLAFLHHSGWHAPLPWWTVVGLLVGGLGTATAATMALTAAGTRAGPIPDDWRERASPVVISRQ